MKKVSACILIALSVLCMGYQSIAQQGISVRYLNQLRWESQLSYCFFTGPDAADFNTSIHGFGSGILDVFGGRTTFDLINVGTREFYLSTGVGFAVTKYRLSKNLVFGKTVDSRVTWTVDPDPAHHYVNTFFGYGKSKIITASFYIPADLNLTIGKNVVITAGVYLDLNLTARYKMKYLVGGDRVKEIIRSADFRELNPNTRKFGVHATFFHRKLGYGLSASYPLTPFFRSGLGPDIHEVRISASYRIRDLSGLRKKKE